MKKPLIILMSLIVIAGSISAAIYLVMRSQNTPSYYTLKDSFTSNISDSKKYAIFSVFLKLDSKGHDKYLNEHVMVIRNAILFTVREKTENELRDSSVIEAMSAEIISKLNEQIDVDFIESVQFDDFYIA